MGGSAKNPGHQSLADLGLLDYRRPASIASTALVLAGQPTTRAKVKHRLRTY
jgi:hypothetical protein